MTTDDHQTGRATEGLAALAEIAREAAVPTVTEEVRALSERSRQAASTSRAGQFKRGKSTLINALVGPSVLPTGVVPVTAVPTVLRDGDAGARVRLHDGEWHAVALDELADYVTEEHNPGNAKGSPPRK